MLLGSIENITRVYCGFTKGFVKPQFWENYNDEMSVRLWNYVPIYVHRQISLQSARVATGFQ
jgi:hypothetical protein